MAKVTVYSLLTCFLSIMLFISNLSDGAAVPVDIGLTTSPTSVLQSKSLARLTSTKSSQVSNSSSSLTHSLSGLSSPSHRGSSSVIPPTPSPPKPSTSKTSSSLLSSSSIPTSSSNSTTTANPTSSSFNSLTTSYSAPQSTSTGIVGGIGVIVNIGDDETVNVKPGTIVKGGKGGGTFVVDGVPYQISEGQTVTATEGPTTGGPTSTLQSSASSSLTSTSSSSAQRTPYVVISKDNQAASDLSAVTQQLTGFTSGAVTTLTIDAIKRVSWIVNITSAQANTLSTNSAILYVLLDVQLEEDLMEDNNQTSTTASKRSIDYERYRAGKFKKSLKLRASDRVAILQSDAETELKFVSQPSGISLDNLAGFAYDESAGKGITVYVIDTGANIEHSEWTGMPGSKKFLYATSDTTESDPGNHGACVLSKVAGPKYGVAKNADIVLVKTTQYPTFSSVLAGFVEVANDVATYDKQGKAVVNLSIGSTFRNENDPNITPTINAYKLYLQTLIADDIVIVTASGNDALYGFDHVRDYPAKFINDIPIIVVGGLDDFGERSPESQGEANELTLSAPSGVTCADGFGTSDIQRVGTSYAAPAVAGLAATLLGLDEYKSVLQVEGSVAKNMRTLLTDMAYSRAPGYPLAVYNDLNPNDLSCVLSSKKRAARGSCSASSVSSAAPSTKTSLTLKPTTSPTISNTSSTPSASASCSSSTAGRTDEDCCALGGSCFDCQYTNKTSSFPDCSNCLSVSQKDGLQTCAYCFCGCPSSPERVTNISAC